jgi:uncharacterized RDD family membrane protein YckC
MDEIGELKSWRAPSLRRMGAYLVDEILFVVIPAAVIGGIAAVAVPDVAPAIAGLVVVVAAIFGPALFLARKGESNGQTPGKKLLGLRVRTYDEPAISFGRAVGREAVKVVTMSLPLINLINVGAALMSTRRLTAQDDICDTIVVREQISQVDAARLAQTPDGRFLPAPAAG